MRPGYPGWCASPLVEREALVITCATDGYHTRRAEDPTEFLSMRIPSENRRPAPRNSADAILQRHAPACAGTKLSRFEFSEASLAGRAAERSLHGFHCSCCADKRRAFNGGEVFALSVSVEKRPGHAAVNCTTDFLLGCPPLDIPNAKLSISAILFKILDNY